MVVPEKEQVINSAVEGAVAVAVQTTHRCYALQAQRECEGRDPSLSVHVNQPACKLTLVSSNESVGRVGPRILSLHPVVCLAIFQVDSLPRHVVKSPQTHRTTHSPPIARTQPFRGRKAGVLIEAVPSPTKWAGLCREGMKTLFQLSIFKKNHPMW